MTSPQNRKTGLAIASLVIGIVSLPTGGCLLVGALVGIVLGIVALVKASRSPEEYGGQGFAIGGIVTSAISLVLLPFVGIIAAIAIPSLLRARVAANEAAAIGDIRTVISAEAAYAASNGGLYDSPPCLATPGQCIPDYKGPSFLDEGLASLESKTGYQRSFEPGPPADTSGGHVSPSSVRSYAYLAVPITKGQTGVRGFCGDSSGQICYTRDGSAPEVVNGSCSETCPKLH